ncbi:trypsin-like peptidase domain-containing protein [Amycolatopsis sp. K13G38]|uniref:Trypsin-like peptidase domain-containing protein n=1 Tax=Amycolatopsis acididurans TaxID=2724524 RepID=A0ABX1J8J3_9PSEU|nr:serine protease [Amycolatopsis acididurans]NKQ55979.1 trypsin-like peptidase domain-containing protein [Amycolatopsis acididurans]
MWRSWSRSCAVLVVAATAVVGGGTAAVDPPVPVSMTQIRETTTTSAIPPAASTAAPLYAAAGALFSGGRHFCSASVVDSPAGDLVLTAAHCVQAGTPADLSFAPAYHDGVAPYGMWPVTSVVVPDGWASSADPDLDFAFLIVHQDGNPRPVQSLTGAEKLGIDRGFVNDVTLVGYPDSTQSPVICRDTTTQESAYQQRIACPGYPDGTSGGPWLTDVDPATGNGTVIGVIGGYEQGGDSPDVSYSAYFDQDIQKLYETVAR